MSNCIKEYSVDELPIDFAVRNDYIRDIHISCSRGFCLSLNISWGSNKQGVGGGYHNTDNIGRMILALAQFVLDVEDDWGDTNDILKKLIGKPVRVAEKKDYGAEIVKCTYIGHFMVDKFMYCYDWVQYGFCREAK